MTDVIWSVLMYYIGQIKNRVKMAILSDRNNVTSYSDARGFEGMLREKILK